MWVELNYMQLCIAKKSLEEWMQREGATEVERMAEKELHTKFTKHVAMMKEMYKHL